MKVILLPQSSASARTLNVSLPALVAGVCVSVARSIDAKHIETRAFDQSVANVTIMEVELDHARDPLPVVAFRDRGRFGIGGDLRNDVVSFTFPMLFSHESSCIRLTQVDDVRLQFLERVLSRRKISFRLVLGMIVFQ